MFDDPCIVFPFSVFIVKGHYDGYLKLCYEFPKKIPTFQFMTKFDGAFYNIVHYKYQKVECKYGNILRNFKYWDL